MWTIATANFPLAWPGPAPGQGRRPLYLRLSLALLALFAWQASGECPASWSGGSHALGQIVSGYSSLPGFSENVSQKRIGDVRRFAKAQSRLSHQLRVGDELWVISTRHIPAGRSDYPGCGSALDLASFADVDVAMYQAGCWMMSSPAQIVEAINADQTRDNILFIHGNRTDLDWANLRGVETYESLVLQSEAEVVACPTHGPVRWIIWAWPSDPVHGPRADLAIKRRRAIGQGRYLREFIQLLRVDSLGVVAYSLGAQALVSALCAPEETAPQGSHLAPPLSPKLRVVMLAGAVPLTWMQSVEADECFQRHLTNLTLINNTRDRALAVYRKFTGVPPIGSHGYQLQTSVPAETFLLTGNQLDNHFLSHYLEHPQTRQIIRSRLLQRDDGVAIDLSGHSVQD